MGVEMFLQSLKKGSFLEESSSSLADGLLLPGLVGQVEHSEIPAQKGSDISKCTPGVITVSVQP